MAENVETRPQWVVEAIKVKATRRRVAYKKREEEALKVKEEGSRHFRNGDYETAAICYNYTCQLDFIKPTYMANLFAALIKLQDYETVVDTAGSYLAMDPTHKKLRYRRLQARRALGFHAGALSDAKAIVRQSDTTDADLTAIHREIKELELLIKSRPIHLRDRNITNDEYETDDEDDSPNETQAKSHVFDIEAYWTESEDDPHVGTNGVPCRYYNRQKGCLKGDKCTFSHAPDDMSERDLMGKNVCNYWLLDQCRFTDDTCNYFHSRVALPTEGWWTSALTKRLMAYETKGKSKQVGRRIRATKRSFADPQGVTGVQTGLKTDKKTGKKKKASKKSQNRVHHYDDDDWMDENMDGGMGFFSPEDEFDLLCQGVKPWDDDAADVLAVLNGDYY